ncbi:MAG: ABC transporter substrate-binding protein [Nocardioides sp.]|nr:ABC transporter substrate-binding protein [Nocardioides sp.]
MRLRRGVLVATTCLLLAACGTRLDPSVVAAAGGTGAGSSSLQGGPAEPGTGFAGADGGTDTGGPVGDAGGDPADAETPAGAGPSAGEDAGPGGSDGSRAGAGSGSGSPAVTTKPETACTGLRNGTGISNAAITIGNASDISGPVPGLFAEAREAVRAFVRYFNDSGSRICGRRLELVSYDSRTDNGADQQAYTRGCSEVFAMVGSMSGFDSGGARTAERCGLPDVRAIATTRDRSACRTCWPAQPAGPDEFQNAVPDFIKRSYGGGQKAAMLYLKGGAATENGPAQVRHQTKRGMKFVYTAGVDLAEFNYAPYVQAMRERGVETVQFVAAAPQFVRLAQAMQQQGFKPKLLLLDPTAYSPQYTEQAGSAAVGTVVFMNFTPFEEAARNEELRLYLSYLRQVNPSASPGFFGLFAWSAARLFAQEAARLGGDLDRASLVRAVSGVQSWTANSLHSPQRVSQKRVSECWRFVRWTGKTWESLQGRDYHCRGTTR